MPPQRRVFYLDNLRALATIAVIILHVASTNWYGNVGSYSWNVFTVYTSILRFCVPIFVMISGVLFLNDSYQINIKKLFFHNIFKLCVFLVFWSIVYQFYNILIDNKLSLHLFKQVFINIIKGDTPVHFWYIYVAIGLYIITPIVKVFTQNANKVQLQYAIFIFFLFNIIPTFISTFHNSKILFSLYTHMARLNVGISSGYVGYYLLGHYLDKYEISKKFRIYIYILGIIGSQLGLVLTWYLSVHHNAPIETYLNYTMPGICLWGISVFVFFKYHHFEKQHVLVKWISKHSMGIYACHMLVILVLTRFGFSTVSFHPLLSVPLISLLVLLISISISYILKKLPYINRFIA